MRQVQLTRQASGVWRSTFWNDHVGRVAETPCLFKRRRVTRSVGWPHITAESDAALIKWTREAAVVQRRLACVWPVSSALKSTATHIKAVFPSGGEPERLPAGSPALLTLGCRWETNLLTERLYRPHQPPLLMRTSRVP